MDQGVPVRSGGFGGALGLATYLTSKKIDLLIDATHPYAARISANAAEAARLARRYGHRFAPPGGQPVEGDRWTLVDNADEAVSALGNTPRKIFLALGRQEITPFEAAPQHAYLIRSVDPVEPPLNVPDATYIVARGPFSEVDDRSLLEARGIDAIVAKNSGGGRMIGKIAAARKLGIEVILFRRPQLPDIPSGATVEEVAALVDHAFDPPESVAQSGLFAAIG